VKYGKNIALGCVQDWIMNVVCMAYYRNAKKFHADKSEDKRPLGRPRSRCEI